MAAPTLPCQRGNPSVSPHHGLRSPPLQGTIKGDSGQVRGALRETGNHITAVRVRQTEQEAACPLNSVVHDGRRSFGRTEERKCKESITVFEQKF